MRKNQKSIAFRLSIFVLFGASLLFLFFGFVNYQVSRRTWIQNAELNADVVTSKAVMEIKSQLLVIENVAEDLKYVLFTPARDDDELLKILMQGYFENLEGLVAVSFISKPPGGVNGSCQWSYYYGALDTLVTRIPYDPDLIKWENDPRETRRPEWSETQAGVFKGNEKTITYSVPLADRDSLYGLFNVHVSLTWLDEMVASLEVYRSGLAIIVASNGVFLTHPTQKEAIGNRSLQNPLREELSADLAGFFDEMKINQSGYAEMEDPDFTNDRIFLIYRPLEVMNGFLLLYVPKKEVLGDLVRTSTILLLIAIVSFSLLIMVVFMVSRKMLSPLNQLSRTIMKIGEGDFNVDLPEYSRMDEIGNLSHAFSQMRDDLKEHVVLLDESTSERDQIRTEINVAAKIQKSIIPTEPPHQLTEKGYSIYGILRPAKTVGGDFYDFFMKGDQRLYFVIGDVTGKGVPASFFMGMARTFFRTESKYAESTGDLLFRINEDLCMNNPEAIFITMFCGILDIKTGKMEFTNAGHNFPIFARLDGTIKRLEHQHGPPVGLVTGQSYSSDQLLIRKDELLLLYTDGVTEARDENGQIFGEERLKNLAEEIQRTASDAESFSQTLLDHIESYESGAEQSDDLSVLTLKRKK